MINQLMEMLNGEANTCLYKYYDILFFEIVEISYHQSSQSRKTTKQRCTLTRIRVSSVVKNDTGECHQNDTRAEDTVVIYASAPP